MKDDPVAVQQRIQSSILSKNTIGNYEIVRKIGEGSFSSVYLAVHVMTRLEVVLKSAAKTQSNLAAEIANMSRLSHPHIVRLYEYIIMPDKVWLVLEYCGGDELLNFLVKSRGNVPIPICSRLFSQLAGAVAYAHQLHCAHRDLKLENVLLDKDGNIKLGDFGFTRSYVPRTFLETVCGTESYMAPELLLRKKYLPEAADVWSLGVILYALLYGRLPFDEDNTATTVRKIVEEDPPFPRPNCGSEDSEECRQLVDIVKRMLHKNPHQRPRAIEMLDSLGEMGRQQKHLISRIISVPEATFMFSSKEERTVLKGMKAMSIDLHAMASSVVHHKCDPLHGLWYTALDRYSPHRVTVSRARSKTSLYSAKKVGGASNPVLLNSPKSTVPSPGSKRLSISSAIGDNEQSNGATTSAAPTNDQHIPAVPGKPKGAFEKLISALKIRRGTERKDTLMAYYNPALDNPPQQALPKAQPSVVATPNRELSALRKPNTPPLLDLSKFNTPPSSRRQSVMSISSSISFSLADTPSKIGPETPLPQFIYAPNQYSASSNSVNQQPASQQPPQSLPLQPSQFQQSASSQQSMSRPMSTYSQVSQISQLSQSSIEVSKLLAEASASGPGSPQGPQTGFSYADTNDTPPPASGNWRASQLAKRYAVTAPSAISTSNPPVTPVSSRQRARLISVKEKMPHKIEEGESEIE